MVTWLKTLLNYISISKKAKNKFPYISKGAWWYRKHTFLYRNLLNVCFLRNVGGTSI